MSNDGWLEREHSVGVYMSTAVLEHKIGSPLTSWDNPIQPSDHGQECWWDFPNRPANLNPPYSYLYVASDGRWRGRFFINRVRGRRIYFYSRTWSKFTRFTSKRSPFRGFTYDLRGVHNSGSSSASNLRFRYAVAQEVRKLNHHKKLPPFNIAARRARKTGRWN
jgi:hypothetical protein